MLFCEQLYINDYMAFPTSLNDPVISIEFSFLLLTVVEWIMLEHEVTLYNDLLI
jgi:hypothetical protein